MNTTNTATESVNAADSCSEFSTDVGNTASGFDLASARETPADADENFGAVASPNALETSLEHEARLFAARSKSGDGNVQRPLRIFVCDLEFIFDRERYAAYADSEGEDAEKKLRWAFHRVAAAAWMVMRFDPCSDVPVIEEARTIGRDDAGEPAIVSALFDAMMRYPDAICTTWGGEFKDLAVLRRCAGEFGLLIPHQLRNLHPQANERIDLCTATSVLAASMHLPEYAYATGIPCKPWPAKYIGTLVKRGDWKSVREQALGDVLSTSVIALRHLASHGIINCHPQRSLLVIAEAAATAMPSSQFVRNTFAAWVRGEAAAARLKGTVIRAA
jgi:hypothetical protein